MQPTTCPSWVKGGVSFSPAHNEHHADTIKTNNNSPQHPQNVKQTPKTQSDSKSDTLRRLENGSARDADEGRGKQRNTSGKRTQL